jgi:hypothetical protein
MASNSTLGDIGPLPRPAMNRASVYIELLDSLDQWRHAHCDDRWPDVNEMLLDVERSMLGNIHEMTLQQWAEEKGNTQ